MPGKINSLTEEKQAQLLDNTYGVTELHLYEDVQHFCPLGEQVGVTHYDILVEPGKKLAEFVQLHWDIQDLMGKTFTLESGAGMVMDILKKHYPDAEYIKVTSSCGTNRHMAVDCTIEYLKGE